MVATHYGDDKPLNDLERELGYSTKTCAYCGAHLMPAGGDPDGVLLCLNGCYLPHGAKLRMDAELNAAWARVLKAEQE